MRQQNGYNNDHCGVEALARRCNLNICILGILRNLNQNGQRDSQLQVLVKNDPMRHEDHQERQLVAGHVRELLPEIPIPEQELLVRHDEQHGQADRADHDQERGGDETARSLVSASQQVERVRGIAELKDEEGDGAVVADEEGNGCA